MPVGLLVTLSENGVIEAGNAVSTTLENFTSAAVLHGGDGTVRWNFIVTAGGAESVNQSALVDYHVSTDGQVYAVGNVFSLVHQITSASVQYAPPHAVNGTAGADLIDGSYIDSGNDQIDSATSSRGLNRDVVHAGDGNDTVLAGAANDTVLGEAGDDSLVGGAGDDLLGGGSGQDTIDGGSGQDTVSYSQSLGGNSTGVQVDLAAQSARVLGSGDNETLRDIEHVFGTGHADTIAGNVDDNRIVGDAGADLLQGRAGVDTLVGGAGADTLEGGDGADSIFGGDDADLIRNASIGDKVDGGEGGTDNDTLDLRNSKPAGGKLRVEYDSSNSENGTVRYFAADNSPAGTLSFFNIEKVVPCFCAGTLIETPMGPQPIETLQPGDVVRTLDGGAQSIVWAGRRRVVFDDPKLDHLRPVLIRKDAFAPGFPRRDMRVSPCHRVLIRHAALQIYFDTNEALLAAKHLVGLPGIEICDRAQADYVHIMFDTHQLVSTEGLWSESFQPGDQALLGVDQAQRDELLTLFPQLRSASGVRSYRSARMELKPHEARVLLDQKGIGLGLAG